MKLIITHPGQAHIDEVLAIACIQASEDSWIPVERREPTASDLADPEIYVIDVGGEYDPALGNFDHHQDGQDGCALSLVLETLSGCSYQELCVDMPWLETITTMDTQGPSAVAERLGLTRPQLFAAQLNPVGSILCDMFSKGHMSTAFLQEVGFWVLDQVGKTRDQNLHFLAVTQVWYSGGQKVLCVRPSKADPVDGFPSWVQTHHPDAVATVSPNPRGGYSIFRVDASPYVRLERLMDGRLGDTLTFLHKNAFLAVVGKSEMGDMEGQRRDMDLAMKTLDAIIEESMSA